MISFFTVIIPIWIIIALALIIPSWFLSRRGQKKGLLKFLMIWSFSEFVCLFACVIFSRDPFAIFGIFPALIFFLLFLIFCLWWSWEDGKKKYQKQYQSIKQLKLLYKCP